MEPLTPQDAIDEWTDLRRHLSAALKHPTIDAAWIAAMIERASHLRLLAQRDPDTALFLLMQFAGSEVDQYGSHHAMLCAVVCEMCARLMEWPEPEVQALVRAALTMNLSMASAQDEFAKQVEPLTEAQHAIVAGHAASSADLLAQTGAADALWIDIVRLHDRDAPQEGVPESTTRLAQLLRRVDIYTAKLSRRVSRDATSSAVAARDACLDANGLPDEIGATMLRSMGLYPPGTYVVISNGELAIVIRRGTKAHSPVVAALRRSDGGMLLQPTRRDTASRRDYTVVRSVAAKQVKLVFNPVRVLGC